MHHQKMSWLGTLTDRATRRWWSAIGGELEPGWRAVQHGYVPASTVEHHIESVAALCTVELSRQDGPLSTLANLANHAHHVRVGAVRNGWRAPQTPADWTPAEWTGTRLLACYLLASQEPHGPELSTAAAKAIEGIAGSDRVSDANV